VLADDPGVVDDESRETGHEGVLNHWYVEVSSNEDVQHEEEWRQDDEGQLWKRNHWFSTELLVFEIQRVDGTGSLGFYWLYCVLHERGGYVFTHDTNFFSIFIIMQRN